MTTGADPGHPAPDRRHLRAAPVQDDPRSWDADHAVRVMFTSHWVPMVRLAGLLLQETSAAEEVVQDAFVALHRRWPRLKDPHTAAGYLRTSVVNGCRSVHRHRDVEVRHRQPAAPQPPGPEERALAASQDREVMAALRTLPRRQQEVLVLRYYGDASEAEIAETLGISPGAVKSHASRGMSALRAVLTASPPDGSRSR